MSTSHSMIRQSYSMPYLPGIVDQLAYDPEKNAMRNHEINQDGWGVGWYDSTEAGIVAKRVRSASGATNEMKDVDADLASLLESGLSSPVIFSHIRAATDGDSEVVNSHPFQFHRLLWMHNGGIADKHALLQTPIARCNGAQSEDTLVRGQTDSEIAGALFTSYLNHSRGPVCTRELFDFEELREAMFKTVQRIDDTSPCVHNGSSLNFAVTDGVSIIVTRFRTCKHEEPPSLYYSLDRNSRHEHSHLWVSSEPLDAADDVRGREWVLLAKDQMLSYQVDKGDLILDCLSAACKAELTYRQRPKTLEAHLEF